jgi:hypothetical protein
MEGNQAVSDEFQPKPPQITSDPGGFTYPTDPRTGVPTMQYTKISSDADALKNHLMWGEAAIAYVRRYMTIGASHKLTNVVGSLGESLICVSKLRSEYAGGAKFANWHDAVAENSRLGRLHGCGNCGEQSAIAYMFFFNNSMKPIDWITVNRADHQFTLLGCATGAGSYHWKWGPRCVVVDPWNGECYPGSEIAKHRWSGKTYTSLVQE